MTQPPFFTVVCKRPSYVNAKTFPLLSAAPIGCLSVASCASQYEAIVGLAQSRAVATMAFAPSSLSVGWQGLNPINVPQYHRVVTSSLHFVPRSHRRPSSCRVSIALSTQAFKAGAIKRFYMAGEIDRSVSSIVKIDRLHSRHR
jgi:hypothetical protein